MVIPEEISSIFEKIKQSEKEWKALYMAVWHYSSYIKKEYIEKSPRNTNLLVGGLTGTAFVINAGAKEFEIDLSLPESKDKSYRFNVTDLYNILVSRDGQFTLGHLQTLFSLLEDFLKTVHLKIYLEETDGRSGMYDLIKSFFKLDDFKCVMSETDLKEMNLAIETRNSYIHRKSLVNERFIAAFTTARGSTKQMFSIGDNLISAFPSAFQQVEDWHNLIMTLTESVMKILREK